MNELLSEEIPFNDIPHDEFLAIKICKGFRPTISEDIPNSDTSYTAQSTSANPISECLDCEIKRIGTK
ncbi:unnamed protein product [Rhizophagus irregularis]|nr:unnamed protein product [Rhizophagus irregularis]CAB5213657.1 unnamed protein product [Rhizophagus irregularis]